MKPARTSVRISTTTVLFAACTAAAAQSPRLSFRAGVPPAPRYVGAADLDGDGDLDLATRNPVQFAANDGAGRFALTDPSAPSGIALPLPEPAFVFDDFDGDGTADVLRVSNGVANVLKAELFRGSPGAGPSATPLVSSLPNIGILGNTYPAIVSASGGDLDGDGDLDLVVGRYDVPAAYPLVLFNLGNGTFTLSPTFFGLVPVGGGVCVGVLRDLDADGDFDWAVAGTTTLAPGGAFVQWNVGGVFGSPVVVLPAGLATNAKRVDCGDVDGDGRLDLAVFGNGGGAVARQTAPGVFGPVDLFANPGAAPPMSGGGCLGDFEGDGVPEAAVVGPTGVFVHRFAAGAFVQVAALPRPGIEALAFDADGDGDDDLLVEQYSVVGSGVPLVKSMPLFFSGGGVPQFEPDGLLDVPFGYSRHVPVDMNADGVPDLFGYGATSGGIRPHTTTNDGLGSFGPRVDYPCAGAPGVGPQTVGTVVHGITPFDLDGDGQREFLVTDAFSGIGQPVDAVLAADANGGYVATPLTGNAIPNQAITRARSVDLDADGDDDLLVVLADGFARVRWSSGGSLGVGILLNAGASDGVVAGDYDDDGDLDVVTASSAHFRVFVQGPAGWTFGPLVAGGGAPHAVDVDGDGMTDLVVGDSYFRRTGPLAFAPPLPATGVAGLDVAVTLDVDGDGDPDLLAEDGTLLTNDGAGGFTAAQAVFAPGTALVRGVADFDVDGDDDLLLAGPRILWARGAQLWAPTTPRIGTSLRIDVEGPANGAWLLAACPSPSAFASIGSPWGRLLLDPAFAVVLAQGPIDANGAGAVDAYVDAATGASLLGQPFLVQAVVAGGALGARLTNGRVVTLADY